MEREPAVAVVVALALAVAVLVFADASEGVGFFFLLLAACSVAEATVLVLMMGVVSEGEGFLFLLLPLPLAASLVATTAAASSRAVTGSCSGLDCFLALPLRDAAEADDDVEGASVAPVLLLMAGTSVAVWGEARFRPVVEGAAGGAVWAGTAALLEEGFLDFEEPACGEKVSKKKSK